MPQATSELKRLRLQAGLSQTALARKAELDRATVANAESGAEVSELSLSKLMKTLEESLGENLDYDEVGDDDVTRVGDFERVQRPWGWYQTLARDPRFAVKRIMVRPRSRLSLQSHAHRAATYTVIQGVAQVSVGSEVSLLAEGQSIYIPAGAIHRLENPGKANLSIIEVGVRSGPHIGEDTATGAEDAILR